jgi:hypothetical protein
MLFGACTGPKPPDFFGQSSLKKRLRPAAQLLPNSPGVQSPSPSERVAPFGGHQLLRGSSPHASLDGFVWKGNRAFGGHQLLRGSSPHASLDGFVCKGNRAFGGHQLLRGSPPHASLDGFVCGGRERSPSLDLLERRMRSAANKRKTTGETLHPSDDTPGVPPPGSSTRSRCAKGTVASEGDYDLSLRMGTLRTGPGSFYKLNGRLVSKAIPG